MANYHTGNRYLTQAEMEVNARFVADYLHVRGWSLNAIAGLLGNMQTESSINPGIWQSLKEGNTSGGYGLVQWTPATKYLSWCEANGLEPSAMESALDRIEYELANGLQWIKTKSYPLTFAQFKTSTEDPYYLGQAFMKNYERPANQATTKRGTQAEKWYTFLTGTSWEGASGTGGKKKSTKGLSLLMLISATRKR